MRATAIFTVASVPFLVLIPLGIALLLNRKFPGRTFFRAMIFAPFVLGVAVIGVMFRYLLDSHVRPGQLVPRAVRHSARRLDPDPAVGLGRPGRR